MTDIPVRFSKAGPVAMLVLAGVNLMLFMIVPPKPAFIFVVPILIGVVAVLQLVGTAFIVALGDNGGEVQVKNPLGMTVWRHPFGSAHDLTIQGRKLHVLRTDGKRKTVGGFIADAGDIARLRTVIAERQARKAS